MSQTEFERLDVLLAVNVLVRMLQAVHRSIRLVSHLQQRVELKHTNTIDPIDEYIIMTVLLFATKHFSILYIEARSDIRQRGSRFSCRCSSAVRHQSLAAAAVGHCACAAAV